jgi:D-glycero-D-manno-heptose 1,7-bisphosphate phosphatase
MTCRAVFLDRDGTLVLARHYPRKPEDLVLYAGVAGQLRAVQAAGYDLILITNQGGLAYGFFQVADLDAMHDYLRRELEQQGVHLTGIYYCPHHPRGRLRDLTIECDCRKPKPGMLQRAAVEHGIDLSRSWFIGDILDDVEAGNRAGCRTILVDLGTEEAPTTTIRKPTYVAPTTVDALRIVLAVDAGANADLAYRPRRWAELEPRHA